MAARENDTQKSSLASDGQQYVSFLLDDEEYGIEIMKVQEIIRFTQLTRVPHSSEFVEGVLNLRGRVIPVVDLRKRFGLESADRDRSTRIVVVEVSGRTIGMIVDGVSEVIHIQASEIEPTPPLCSRVNAEFIHGMGKVDERLMILLDIDRILTGEEKAAVTDLVAGMAEG